MANITASKWMELGNLNAERAKKVTRCACTILATTMRYREVTNEETGEIHRLVSAWGYINDEKVRLTFWNPMQVAQFPTLENQGQVQIVGFRTEDWVQEDGVAVPCYSVARMGAGPAMDGGFDMLAEAAEKAAARSAATTWACIRVFKSSVYFDAVNELFTFMARVETAAKPGVFKVTEGEEQGERVRIIADLKAMERLADEEGPATGCYCGMVILRKRDRMWEVRDPQTKEITEHLTQASLVRGAFATDYEAAREKLAKPVQRPTLATSTSEEDVQF